MGQQQFLIDTNAAIDYLSGSLPENGQAIMDEVINAIPNASVITKIEVLGFPTSEKASKLLSDFIDAIIVLDLNDEIVNKTIEIRKSHKIKTPDAIIAATALVFGLILITRNTNDFKNIQNLKLINPHQL